LKHRVLLVGKEEVLNLMRTSLPSTIKIRQYLNSKNTVFADPTNIHQILMNLCTHAGYAMREGGGVLTVSLEDVALEETELANYPGMAAGKFLKITVTDTGHGIPQDIQSKIFDPFFTTKGLGEGTGIGLSAVHGIVRNLGGMVIVNSEPGEGSVFKVFLPIIHKPIEAAEGTEIEVALRGSERILFVDGETIQGGLARDSLEPLGYRVRVFSDSTAAWEHVQAYPDDYDIVVTDYSILFKATSFDPSCVRLKKGIK